MDNDEIWESSLKFLFKQLDLHIEHNKPKNDKNSRSNNDDGWVRLPVEN